MAVRFSCPIRSRAQPEPSLARRRTAQQTGTRLLSIRRPECITSRPTKSAAFIRRGINPEWKAGESYLGGTQRGAPEPRPQRILRAVDYQTGKIKWEIAQPGGPIPGEARSRPRPASCFLKRKPVHSWRRTRKPERCSGAFRRTPPTGMLRRWLISSTARNISPLFRVAT